MPRTSSGGACRRGCQPVVLLCKAPAWQGGHCLLLQPACGEWLLGGVGTREGRAAPGGGRVDASRHGDQCAASCVLANAKSICRQAIFALIRSTKHTQNRRTHSRKGPAWGKGPQERPTARYTVDTTHAQHVPAQGHVGSVTGTTDTSVSGVPLGWQRETLV